MDGRREQTIKATASLTPMKEHKGTRVTSKSVKCVALLPVRYALGDAPSRTPKLSGPFEIKGVAIPDTTDTNYTLRRQRPGYLYVFHEKYQGWSLFKVEPGVRFEGKPCNGGLFTEIKNPEPGFEGVHLRCTIHGLMLVEEDDPIWICFSNHPWSPRVLAGNRENPKLRAAHMRFFDPLNWSGLDQKHVSPLGDAAERVADLMSGVSEKAFWFSNTDFFQLPSSVLKKTLPASRDSKQHPSSTGWKPAPPSPEMLLGQARLAPPAATGSYRVAPGTMIDQMGRLIPPPAPGASAKKRPAAPEETYVPTQPELDRGALIALDDPVGIVMDFRCLMAGRLNRFMAEPERAWRNSCYHAVNTLKANFLSYGEKRYWEEKQPNKGMLALAEAQEQEEIARQARKMGVNPVLTPAYQASFKARHEREAAFDRTIYAKVQTARWEAWKPYDDKVDWKTLNQWPEKLSQQYDTCRIKELDPLAEAHAAWMQSALLGKVFKHHYHSSDLDKEGRYAELARLCIEGTQAWKACRDLYGRWMREESLAPGNILLRAFLDNGTEALAEAREQPSSAGIDFNTFMKKIVLPVFKQKVKDGGNALKAQRKELAKELQGVLSELLGESMEKDQGQLSLAIVAASEEAGLRLVTFNKSTVYDVIMGLTDSVEKVNPGITRGAAMNSVLHMMSKYDPKTFAFEAPTKWVFAFKDSQLSEAGVTGTAYGAILPWDDLSKLPHSRWDCFKASAGKFAVIALICQTASLWSSIKSFKSAPLWKETEETWRLRAGAVAWAGAVAAVSYSAVAPEIVLGLSKPWHYVIFKHFGVAAAIGNGLIDVWKAVEAFRQDDMGLSGLYFASSVSGVVSGVLLGTTWFSGAWVPVVGWTLLLVFIGVQVAISKWEQIKVQNWFKHCIFGKDPGYQNGVEELKELRSAMGWS